MTRSRRSSAIASSTWLAVDASRPGHEQDVEAAAGCAASIACRHVADPAADAIADDRAPEALDSSRCRSVVPSPFGSAVDRALIRRSERTRPIARRPRSRSRIAASRAPCSRAGDRGGPRQTVSFCGPWPAGRRAPSDRPWTSCGRGSHAPSRDGASWAGRSASSRGVGSLAGSMWSVSDPVVGRPAPWEDGGPVRSAARNGLARQSNRGMIGRSRMARQTRRCRGQTSRGPRCSGAVAGMAMQAPPERGIIRRRGPMGGPGSILPGGIGEMRCGA